MKVLIVLAALALAGCGSVQRYAPLAMDVTDRGALDRDTAQCRQFAAAHPSPFDIAGIGSAGVEGAARNAAAAAVSPWAPVLSGAGSAGAETLQDIGLLDTNQIKILLLCLDHRGQKSGLYSIVDPRL